MEKEKLESFNNIKVGDKVIGAYGSGTVVEILKDECSETPENEVTIFVRYQQDNGLSMTVAEYPRNIHLRAVETKRIDVWFRLGATVNLSVADIRKIKNGDKSPLYDAMIHGRVEFGGDSYIPQDIFENQDIPQELFADGDISFEY